MLLCALWEFNWHWQTLPQFSVDLLDTPIKWEFIIIHTKKWYKLFEIISAKNYRILFTSRFFLHKTFSCLWFFTTHKKKLQRFQLLHGANKTRLSSFNVKSELIEGPDPACLAAAVCCVCERGEQWKKLNMRNECRLKHDEYRSKAETQTRLFYFLLYLRWIFLAPGTVCCCWEFFTFFALKSSPSSSAVCNAVRLCQLHFICWRLLLYLANTHDACWISKRECGERVLIDNSILIVFASFFVCAISSWDSWGILSCWFSLCDASRRAKLESWVSAQRLISDAANKISHLISEAILFHSWSIYSQHINSTRENAVMLRLNVSMFSLRPLQLRLEEQSTRSRGYEIRRLSAWNMYTSSGNNTWYNIPNLYLWCLHYLHDHDSMRKREAVFFAMIKHRHTIAETQYNLQIKCFRTSLF